MPCDRDGQVFRTPGFVGEGDKKQCMNPWALFSMLTSAPHSKSLIASIQPDEMRL